MAEAAINLGFLAATTYIVGRDAYSYLPSSPFPKTSSKRLRGEPSVTHAMDEDTCDPATRPPRISRGPALAPSARAAVRSCCESLLEQKFSQDRVTGVVPLASGVPRVTCLNDLSQGTDASQRIGNKILMKSLQIEGQFFLAPNVDSDIYRFIVVLDHECFGASCTFSQYTQGAPSQQIVTLPSWETVGKGKRFTTLVDKSMVIQRPDAPGATAASVLRTFSLTIPLSASAMYSGNTGTISDLVRNSLCVIEASAAARVNVEWQSRLLYLDG